MIILIISRILAQGRANRQTEKERGQKMKKRATNLDIITYSLMFGMIIGIVIGMTSGIIGANHYNDYKYQDCICPIDNKYQPANRASTAPALPAVPNVPDIEEIRY